MTAPTCQYAAGITVGLIWLLGVPLAMFAFLDGIDDDDRDLAKALAWVWPVFLGGALLTRIFVTAPRRLWRRLRAQP